jgi:hypothetical protein
LEKIKTKWRKWWQAPDAPPPPWAPPAMIPVEAINSMMEAILRTKLAQAGQEAPPRKGIKPPPDPGSDTPMTFTAWRQVMGEIALGDDWSPCRFGTLYGHDQLRLVFGCTRGPFGIYRQPFDMCQGEESIGEHVLCALIWLPGGLGLGLFDEASLAVETVDLIGDRLSGFAHPGSSEEARLKWFTAFEGIRSLMTFHGVVPHPSKHAHDGASTPLTVYTKSSEAVLTGKPEKLG